MLKLLWLVKVEINVAGFTPEEKAVITPEKSVKIAGTTWNSSLDGDDDENDCEVR